MFFTGPNGRICSTLSGAELTELGNIKIKDPCTMALETDREIMNLFDEMFGDDDGRGQDSAFMDDQFGG